MSTDNAEIALRTPNVPARISQSTRVEQSREIAEVQARVMVAQQCPRNITTAISAMRESCSQRALADRAFFRYPRGGQQISGETIHLARELARVWTNIDYGIRELDRDDSAGVSEMVAFAWDMQANTRVSNAFIVPHARDREGGKRDQLTALRDIYENNTNMGARRVRECIFGVLPPFLIEEAKTLCLRTLSDDGTGKTPAQQAADAIAKYATIGVTGDQLEAKVGRPAARWTPPDLAHLRVVFLSIDRKETTVDEEFSAPAVTSEQIATARRPRATKATPPPVEPTVPAATSREAAKPERPADPAPAASVGEAYAVLEEMLSLFADAEIDGDERLAYASDALGIDVANLAALDLAQRIAVVAALRSYIAQNEPPAGVA